MDSEPEEVVMMPFDRHWNTDDVLIFTKSEMAANRVMNSISDWLERKYLGFTFLKNGGEWKVKPTNEKKKKLKKKLSEYLKRGKAIARPLVVTIKKPKTIYRNLSYLNGKNRNGLSQEDIHKVANSRLGWYRRSGMNVVNFIISKDLLENRIKDGAGLLNPLSYYLVKVGI